MYTLKTYFLFLCFFIIGECNAQLINTAPLEIPLGPLNFNREFIKQHRIKSIYLDIVDKPDGEIIVDRDALQGYEFDLSGRLIRYYYTVLTKAKTREIETPEIKKKGKVIRPYSTKTLTEYMNDTIFVNVYYDAQDRIVSKRLKTGDFYMGYYYEYNDKQQIKKEVHFRETNINENKKLFTLGVQTLQSSETFLYTPLTPKQIKKSCLNDVGREYKNAIMNYDARGNKISENYDFTISWMHQYNSFKYDDSNQLIERITNSNENGEQNLRFTYSYDSKRWLLSESKYKNGVLQNEISYLYDSGTTLIKSQINRDFKNSSIGIIKYFYTFY